MTITQKPIRVILTITLNSNPNPLSLADTDLPTNLVPLFEQFAIPQQYQVEVQALIDLERKAIEQRIKRVAEIRKELTPILPQLKSDFLSQHPEYLL